MQSRSFASHGIKWGLIIAVVYCLLLWVRYKLGEDSAIYFGAMSFVGFVIALVLLLISGFQLRKANGGYIDTKSAFKTMFISVLIYELIFAIFNFIYLKYIDPEFYLHLRQATEKLLLQTAESQDKIDSVLKGIDVDAPKKMNILDLLKGYLFFVAVSGVFAFLFAVIIRKNPPPSESTLYNQA